VLRLDLHVHSDHSFDGAVPVARLLELARRRGLDGIAVTDHNRFAGSAEALRLNRDPDFLVIPGAEYTTDAGHILALFIDGPIALESGAGVLDRLPWRETVQAIHEAGGVAVLAHPFKRRTSLEPAVLAAVDGIEAFNARTVCARNRRAVTQALDLAASGRFRLRTAGSDAHWPAELGRAWVEIPHLEPGAGPAAVRAALEQGRVRVAGRGSHPLYESMSQFVRCRRLGETRRLPRVAARTVLNAVDGLAAWADGRLRRQWQVDLEP